VQLFNVDPMDAIDGAFDLNKILEVKSLDSAFYSSK
jgi:hypothetical protein